MLYQKIKQFLISWLVLAVSIPVSLSTSLVAHAATSDLTGVSISPLSPSKNNTPIITGTASSNINGVAVLFGSSYRVLINLPGGGAFTTAGKQFSPIPSGGDVSTLPDGSYSVVVLGDDNNSQPILDTENLGIYTIDTVLPKVEQAAYVEGTNSSDEGLALKFSENIETVGSTSDYVVKYDQMGNFTGSERTVNVTHAVVGPGSTVLLSIDDQSQQTDIGGKFKVTVSDNVLDEAGNGVNQTGGRNTVMTETVNKFDTNVPTVNLLSPNGGQKLKGGDPITITWTATDTNLVTNPISILISQDDFASSSVLATNESNDGTFSTTLPVVTSPSIKFGVIAKDKSNNIGNDRSDSNIIIDTAAPISAVVTNGSFGPNTWMQKADGEVKGVAIDTPAGIAGINIKIINPDGDVFNGTSFVTAGTGVAPATVSGPNGTIAWSVPISKEQLTNSGEGIYTVESRATDNVGNAESTGTGSFIWDETNPTSPIVNPISSPVNTTSVDITGIAEANSIIVVSGGSLLAQGQTNGSGQFSVPIQLNLNVVNNLVIHSADLAGNISTQTITESISQDAISPIIDIGPDVIVKSDFLTNATVTDSNSGVASYAWTKVSGPGTVTFGTPTAEDTTISADTDGTYVIRLTVVDNAGNTSTDDMNLTWDTIAPVLTLSSPLSGQLFASTTPSAVYSATDATEVTYVVKVDGSVLAGHTSGTSLGSLANGSHTLDVTATDAAGNISTQSTSFTVNSNLSSVTEVSLLPISTNATIDDIADSGIELSGINTTGPVTFNIGQYSDGSNPFVKTGFKAFGKYFEIFASDTTLITFPMTIKIYYTNNDLSSAGISESQIDGLYFYNTSTSQYEKYPDSGANTTDVTIGSVNYSGYVYANVTHLTPIVSVSDTSSLATPGNIKVESFDGKVKLSWDSVAGTVYYKVRYRENNISSNYTYITLAGTQTSVEISGLKDHTIYEFAVASIDQYGNQSSFGNKYGTTSKPTAAVATSIASSSIASDVQSTPSLTTNPKVEDSKDSTTSPDDGGEIKGAEDTAKTSSTNAMTALAILLIALGAGVGGYYLYEWWLSRSAELESVVVNKPVASAGRRKRKGKK